jgi:alpha-L-arabinofuranosidase
MPQPRRAEEEELHAIKCKRPNLLKITLIVWAAILASCLLVLAVSRSAQTQEANLASSSGPTEVVVDPTDRLGAISPLLYGVNHRYGYNGYGMWDPEGQRVYPEFVQRVKDAGLSAVRFPGGTIANLYHWKRAIGPVAQRELNVHGGSGEPLSNEFGPDEFGRFIEEVGAAGTMTVNFATGDAEEAADWVEYMTSPVGSNPRGGTAWADVRAANGHPGPYDIPYWDVSNEPSFGAQGHWMLGKRPPNTGLHELYAFGGSTSFSSQNAVRYADYRSSAAVSDGSPSQVFYAKYPPVAQGSQTVFVAGRAWTPVQNIEEHGPEDVYEFEPSTGRILFGDGVHGNVPPQGAVVTVSYTSGPHDGFVDFYAAMKEVNPDIQVCASLFGEDFLSTMGSTHPYDCVVRHPYVFAGELDDSLPIEEYHSQFLSLPEEKAALVKETQALIRKYAGMRAAKIAVVLTEYGQVLDSNPRAFENYHLTLDQGLYLAEILRYWIRLGIPLAENQNLVDYFPIPPPPGVQQDGSNGVISAPSFVAQAKAHVFTLYTQMMGNTQIRSQVVLSPYRRLQNGELFDALTSVASTDESGNVYLIVINRDYETNVNASVRLVDYPHGDTASVWTVNGPSYLSYNSAENPDAVAIQRQSVPVGSAAFGYTFPAHSVTAIKLVPDTTAPTVKTVVPAEGATGVALGTNVVATFSEEMDPATLSKANFKLYRRTVEGPVIGYTQITNVTVTPSSSGRKVTLDPYGTSTKRLAKDTRYKAVVSKEVKDLAGNAMVRRKLWHFETR